MLIRQETQKDYAEVYELVREAFASAQYADGNEQDLVQALRRGEAYVPELSLVAEINGKLAGHIMFSKARVGSSTVLALAPLSVRPEFQGQGVGTALMNRAHDTARKLGYEYSFVLGSELYYPRVGYIPADSLGVSAPEGIPPEKFMGLKLSESAEPISGELVYAEEFGI